MAYEDSKTIIVGLGSHYRTGQSDLAKDFFLPCLMHCSQYRRAVGYFSSSALVTWSAALPRLIRGECQEVRLIASPHLSDKDMELLAIALNDEVRQQLRQRIADHVVLDALALNNAPDSIQLRLQLLAWMVANDRLFLRFAFPTHIDQPGIFHEKIGVFDFPWGDRVAFTGSANETASGHRLNYETVDVYRSWIDGDSERVRTKLEQFEDAWSGTATGLTVLSLSTATLDYIRAHAPLHIPELPGDTLPLPPKNTAALDSHWRHQQEASTRFLEARHGVLEMATGTGKTQTALDILNALDEQNLIGGIIVSTVGTDLLEQWGDKIDTWAWNRSAPYRVFRHYAANHQSGEFALDPHGAILIVSRDQLSTVMARLSPETKRRLIIVHDEVHGLGAPDTRRRLAGSHAAFGYTLGLSATPEREYDEEGSTFIRNEIGDTIYTFGLGDAIARGILCEFDYVPLTYHLTDSDKQRGSVLLVVEN